MAATKKAAKKAAKKTPAKKQEPEIVQEKIKLRTRMGIDRMNTEIVVNGRYVGMMRLHRSEYELLVGLLLQHDVVEEAVTRA